MASIFDTAYALTKAITGNTDKISSAISSGVQKVKQVSAAATVKSKYQPGQILSPADAATIQKVQPVVSAPAPQVPPTQLRAPLPTDKPWESLGTEGQIQATAAEPDILNRLKMGINTIGSAASDFGKQQQQNASDLIAKPGSSPTEKRIVQTMGGTFAAPANQLSEGLKMLSGGQDLQQKPQIVQGLASTAMGLAGVTPGGAAFNAVVNEPSIKPLADATFGWLSDTSKKVTSLPIINQLPPEAKSTVELALQALPFVALHHIIKLPFETSKEVEMPDPTTGDMVKVRVPTDTAGWAEFKKTLSDQITQLKADPIGFLKSQQLGMSIKDVSGEPAFNPDKIPVEQAKIEADKGFKSLSPDQIDQGNIPAQKLNEHIKAKQAEAQAQYDALQENTANRNQKILQSQMAPKETFWKQVKTAFQPMKELGETVKNAWEDRTKSIVSGNEKANVDFQKLADIPIKEGPKVIQDYQAGIETPYSERIKQAFDAKLAEARDRGFKVETKQNYLPQVYAESPEQIHAAISKKLIDSGLPQAQIEDYINGKPLPSNEANRLRLSPTFTKESTFSSYAQAKEYGLTPKFNHPGQLLAYYTNQLETSLANRKWLETMKENNDLIDHKTAGYEPINTSFSGNDQLYATPKLAKAINEYFRNNDNLGLTQKAILGIGKVNKAMSELVLSGGIPGTNVNFFTTGQINKSLNAGDIGVLGRAVISNSDRATLKYFKENQPYISKMADAGIDLSNRTGNWDNIFHQASSATGLGKVMEGAGEIFDKAFNKKTFASFMPMQVVETYKNTYETGIKQGLTEMEAKDLAAKTTKAFNATTEDWGRSKNLSDNMNALLFAPKFRESLVNLYGETLKSITTQIGNPAYKLNRRLLAGATITYLAYNLANKQLTGHYMYENDPGHEFGLQVPYGDGKYAYVDYMPSILSTPKNIVSGTIAVAKGDVATAGQKFSSLGSMPVQLAANVMTNKDYFGKPIWDVNASTAEQIKSIASYVGLSYNHPYVQAIYKSLFAPDGKRADPLQTATTILELPLKFGNQTTIDKNKYFQALTDKQKEISSAKIPVQELYDNLQTMKANGQAAEADKIYFALPDDQKKLYKDIKSADKSAATKQSKLDFYST